MGISAIEQEFLERLEGLKYYSTTYEIVLTDGKTSKLISYGRKGRRSLIEAVQSKGSKILEVVNMSDDFQGKITTTSMDLSGGWYAKFSGRTKRQAIMEGELEKL